MIYIVFLIVFFISLLRFKLGLELSVILGILGSIITIIIQVGKK